MFERMPIPNFYARHACEKCCWGAHKPMPDGRLSEVRYDADAELLRIECARCGAEYTARPADYEEPAEVTP